MEYFLESKKFKKIQIKSLSSNNISLINEGSSLFKNTSFFNNGIIIGFSNEKILGNIRFNNQKKIFEGYDGEEWIKLNNKNNIEETESNIINGWNLNDNIIYSLNKKIGIGKNNPQKLLDIGGDVSIDGKLYINNNVIFNSYITLHNNKGKNKKGSIRFFNNNFEGYNGEKWINFSENNNENKYLSSDKIELKLSNYLYTTIKYNLKEYILEIKNKNTKNSEETNCFTNLKINSLIVNSNIDMQNNKILNVKYPENNNDIATKEYVDKKLSKNIFICDYFIDVIIRLVKLIIHFL